MCLVAISNVVLKIIFNFCFNLNVDIISMLLRSFPLSFILIYSILLYVVLLSPYEFLFLFYTVSHIQLENFACKTKLIQHKKHSIQSSSEFSPKQKTKTTSACATWFNYRFSIVKLIFSIFSFNSYVLSELGHRDKLIDVSVLVPLHSRPQIKQPFEFYFMILFSYPKTKRSAAYAMEWSKRGIYKIRKTQRSCLSSKMLRTIFAIKYEFNHLLRVYFCRLKMI